MHTENCRLFSGSDQETIIASLSKIVRFQDAGMSLDELNGLVRECLVPHFMRYESLAFQSHFHCALEAAAKQGALLALEHNQSVTNWDISPGGATLEFLCVRELCRLFELDSNADGTFVYSGTYANQQAIFLALHNFATREDYPLAKRGLQDCPFPRLSIAATSEFHRPSLIHAVRMLGLGENAIVEIPIDSRFRMDVGALRSALTAGKKDRTFFCVLCTAGTTQTGAIDPVAPIAEVCAVHDLWLHVDGAYGLAYRLIPEMKPRFAGIELADSTCWDPHKQMGVPIPSSLLFLRRRENFEAMKVHSSYINHPESPFLNPGLKSPPTTRPLAALAIAMSLRHLGLSTLGDRLLIPLRAVRDAAATLRQSTDIEVVNEPELGILCIRLIRPEMDTKALNRLHDCIHRSIMASGRRAISRAVLNGKVALRLIALSPDITPTDLLDTVTEIRRVATHCTEAGDPGAKSAGCK